MKFLTIEQGERYMVTSKVTGKCAFVDGPTRIFLYRKTKRQMRKHMCTEKQYLEVTYNDGRTRHIHGPTFLYENPLEIRKVTQKPLHMLSASEMIVVYRHEGNADNKGKESGNVVRCNVQGPCVYMLKETEWLHQFSWHGPKPDNKAHHHAKQRNFEVLVTTPESLYYNVKDVRTKDDAILSIKLMLFYYMSDIERMLDTTQDPIGDFLNAVCADVISFASTRDYETLLEESHLLNDLDRYS